MYNFSQETLEILYKNGWYSNRKIDITKFKKYFDSTAQPTSSLIFDFLELFGEITLKFPSKYDDKVILSFTIDPIEGFEDLGLDDLQFYINEWIKKPLCVVGHIKHHNILLMATTGEIYSVFDSWVTKIGDSGENAIENMCSQQAPHLIPKPLD